jgi:NCS1 family nucleobase:cation symporter-1
MSDERGGRRDPALWNEDLAPTPPEKRTWNQWHVASLWAANVVSPANDFSNLAPGRISYKLGGYITAAIGLVIMPWKLMQSYVFVWLNGYGALLGPIGGILVADYWIVRRRQLVVDDLYRRGGAYEYAGGVNPVAIVALLGGIAPNLPGFLGAIGVWQPPTLFVELYAYTWFIGFALAATLYTLGILASRTETKTWTATSRS